MKRIFPIDLYKPKNRNWVYHLLYLIGYKLCNKCNQVYKHEEFYISNKALDKCQASCKYCQDANNTIDRKIFPERQKINYKKFMDKPESKKKKNAYTSARRKRIQQATPKWEITTEIAKIYFSARNGEHVDHDIPLKGINSKGIHIVCGLHTISNLIAIPAKDNLSKGSKFEILTL